MNKSTSLLIALIILMQFLFISANMYGQSVLIIYALAFVILSLIFIADILIIKYIFEKLNLKNK